MMSKKTTGLGSVGSAMVVAVQLAGAEKRVGGCKCSRYGAVQCRTDAASAGQARAGPGEDSTRDSDSRDVGLAMQPSAGRAKAPLDR